MELDTKVFHLHSQLNLIPGSIVNIQILGTITLLFKKNGNLNHTGPSNLAGPVGFPPTGFSSIEDCQWHKAIFNWDPATTNFTLDFDGIQILNYTGDIVNTIFNGNPNVYWGFTGSTGGANNLQRFRFNYDLPDTTICQNDSIIINSLTTASSFTYNWSPNYNISNNTLAAPLFLPRHYNYLHIRCNKHLRLYIY